ncbi:hypothetical protein N332_03381, partial [Mesitornis unicolor]
GLVQGGVELRGSYLAFLRGQHIPLSLPVLQAAIQKGDGFMSKSPEHPPHPWRREETLVAAIIHHNMGVIPHSQLPHILSKVRSLGQHVIVRGSTVAALVDVKENRTRDMALLKFPLRVTLHLRQIPGCIHDSQ